MIKPNRSLFTQKDWAVWLCFLCFDQIPPQEQLSLDDLNHALKDDMPPMDRRFYLLGWSFLRDFSDGEIGEMGEKSLALTWFNMV
jgi:hypothetical protein